MSKLARSASVVAAVALLVGIGLGAVSACVGDDATTAGPGPGEDGASTPDGLAADGMAPPSDAGVDATDAGACSATGVFGDPVEVPGLHVPSARENMVRFSDDGLTALINRGPGDGGDGKLYLSDRASVDVDFGPGAELPPAVNGSDGGGAPGIATFADAKKTIYFEARTVSIDILSSTRATAATNAFSPRATVSGLSGFGDHIQPYFVNDKLYLLFNPGNGDPTRVNVTERGPTMFGPLTPLLNLDGYSFPVVTRNELAIFVSKGARVYEATRSSTGVAFGLPVELPPNVSTGNESATDVSVDGCTLYFVRTTGGERKLFETKRAK